MASEDHFEDESSAIPNISPYFRAIKRSRQKANIMAIRIVEAFRVTLMEHAIWQLFNVPPGQI